MGRWVCRRSRQPRVIDDRQPSIVVHLPHPLPNHLHNPNKQTHNPPNPPKPTPIKHTQTLLTQLVPFQCTRGTHYNELASLFFTDADTAIRQLFHFREVK